MGKPSVVQGFHDLHTAFRNLAHDYWNVKAWAGVLDQYLALLVQTDMARQFSSPLDEEIKVLLGATTIPAGWEYREAAIDLAQIKFSGFRGIVLASKLRTAKGKIYSVLVIRGVMDTFFVLRASTVDPYKVFLKPIRTERLVRLALNAEKALMYAAWGLLDNFTARIHARSHERLQRSLESIEHSALFVQANDLFNTERLKVK